MLYAPGLNELAVAYARTDSSDNVNQIYVATMTPGRYGALDGPEAG